MTFENHKQYKIIKPLVNNSITTKHIRKLLDEHFSYGGPLVIK